MSITHPSLVAAPRLGVRVTDSGAELPSLTALRGVAAVWVVLYHFAVSFFPTLHVSSATQLVGKGYLAVDLFFMMSGFVLTHVYHERLAVPEAGQYWKFLSARVARLYPLHLFILALFVATALASDAVHLAVNGQVHGIPLLGAQSVTALVANLLMLQGLNPAQLSWNYPSWSISVEFIAYLGFPLLLPRIWRASPAWKLALGTALVGLLFGLSYLTHNNFNQWGSSRILLRCLPEFLLGTLLYSVYRSPQFPSLFKTDGLFLAMLAVAGVLLHFGVSDLAVVLLFPAFVLASVANEGSVSGVLNAPVLVWLGERSYALYLFHGLIQFVAERVLMITGHPDTHHLTGAPAFAVVITMFTAALICADLCHNVIEKGGRNYVRRLLAPKVAPA